MKKLLLSVLSATLLTISGSAAPFAKVKNNASGNITPLAANDATEYTFVNQMAGFYTSPQSDDSNAGNYYTLLSTNPDDTYVGSTGEVTSKDAMVLFLDLYAPVSPLTDISLSEGTYKMSDAEEIKEPFRYSNEYSITTAKASRTPEHILPKTSSSQATAATAIQWRQPYRTTVRKGK